MPATREGRKTRILVCCNGRTDALCDALPDASLEVIACANTETMLEEALQRPPDLVLCRQDANGVVDPMALRLVRRLAPGTPLVVLSESTSLQTLRLAQEFRPVFFILEPSEPAELREVVHAVLASRRAGRGHGSDTHSRGRATK